jgi:hypothetical protein
VSVTAVVQGFRHFCSKLNPEYKMPSRDVVVTAVRDECDRLQEKVNVCAVCVSMLSQIKTLLTEVPFGCATSDGWTGPNASYISFTFHYVNAEWSMCELLLRCAPFRGLWFFCLVKFTLLRSGKHSAKHIAEFFDLVVKDYGIADKLLAICTDNDAKYTAAVRSHMKPPRPNPTCGGHNINLLVRPHGIDKVLCFFVCGVVVSLCVCVVVVAAVVIVVCSYVALANSGRRVGASCG